MMLRMTYLAGMVSLCLSGAVQSQGVYGGLGVGAMDADINGLDASWNGSVMLGYAFGDGPGKFAVEAQYTGPVSDGDVNGGGGGDWNIQTIAGYVAYRYGETVYVKARLGYLHESASIHIGPANLNENDDSVSGGVGVGWNINENIAIEGEFTVIESDINFYSAALIYNF